MEKALEGIRVLDMTHVQSGPTCTQLLAWFGADVIKIERPGEGDPTRSQLRDIPGVDSLYFTMLNSNKRSITLNPKTPEGKRIFAKLIEMCDVMVENFAPGAIDRMGFPWEKIQQINPRMIYRSEEHTSELQSLTNLVCRHLLEKKPREHAPAAVGRLLAGVAAWRACIAKTGLHARGVGTTGGPGLRPETCAWRKAFATVSSGAF